MTTPLHLFVSAAVVPLLTAGLLAQGPAMRAAEVIRRFPAAEATQGVAVDGRYFYAIASAAIGKYDKKTGERIGGWQGTKGGRVAHLNGGIVVGNRLYCAHSNYPRTPMVSSIEVFETGSLRLLRSIALPRGRGSATWILQADGDWWVTFAHYAGKGGEPGKGPAATTLVRFDGNWRPERSWSFPASVVERWDGMSSSGGAWAGPGLLYSTGHHAPELHVLQVSPQGRELALRETIRIESEGQGIAVDPVDRLLYSIQRRTREVIVSTMPPLS